MIRLALHLAARAIDAAREAVSVPRLRAALTRQHEELQRQWAAVSELQGALERERVGRREDRRTLTKELNELGDKICALYLENNKALDALEAAQLAEAAGQWNQMASKEAAAKTIARLERLLDRSLAEGERLAREYDKAQRERDEARAELAELCAKIATNDREIRACIKASQGGRQ